METFREERAREVETERLKSIVGKIKELDLGSGLTQRMFIQCSSGNRETLDSIVPLIQSGSLTIDKCTLVFSTLALEVDYLLQESRNKFYDGLLLYGEDAEGLLEKDGGVVEMMSIFLPFLYDLSLFVRRCNEFVRNITLQLQAFFNLSQKEFPNANERLMSRTWRCLGEILGILLILDEIIETHPMLQEHWTIFSKTIQMAQHNPAQFDANDKRFKPLLNMIIQIEQQVISGKNFQNCTGQNFGVDFTADRPFSERFQKIIGIMLTRWDKLASEDMPDKHRLILVFCLAVFYHHQFVAKNAKADVKMLKALFATHRRIVTFHLVGDIVWTPTEFLFRSIPDALKFLDKKSILSVKQTKASLLDKQAEPLFLSREVQKAQEGVQEWKTELKALTEISNCSGDAILNRCMSVLKGARIADRVARLVKCVLNGYLLMDRTLSKSSAQNIFRLIELINNIALTFNFHWPSILEWCSEACSMWSGDLLKILETFRHQIPMPQTPEPKNVALRASVRLAEQVLCSSITKTRLIICGLALEMANYTKAFRSDIAIEIDDLMTRLDTVSNIGLVLSRVTDCSFIYWHRTLASVYFETLFEDSLPIENIELFLKTFQTCSLLFNSVKHCGAESLQKLFQNEIFGMFKEKFLNRLCTEIENNLRLTFHARQNASLENLESQIFATRKSSKSLEKSADINSDNDKRDFRLIQLLEISDFRLGNQLINIKDYVESHLDKTFYNLTVVALHDCESYTKMRLLAKFRYGLHLWPNRLPHMSVDQGLDVLMIMRNIHLFAANYSYDLNEQIFIERNNKSRTLNIMQVDQIVNSIKTHGIGVLNSSVHFAYQYLKKKFQIFSQFLFDAQIKTQLVKEILFYRDYIDDLNQMYPVKRAEDFNQAIRKMGVSKEGKSFLDKFRELITQIGNTLGFIRMFRAGAIESNAYAAQFSPKLEDFESFSQETLKVFDDSSKLKSSADVLNLLNKSVNDTFNNTEDYVEMLITVFAKEFRNYEKFAHLRNFFIIIPALTINYVEYIFACRARLGKRGIATDSNDFTFVDDGFSMGIAYILKLLNQCYFYDSLNWFDSIFAKFKTESEQSQDDQRQALRRKDESYAQSLNIKITRVQDIYKEYEYLNHTLQAALIFFKVKETQEELDETFLEEI